MKRYLGPKRRWKENEEEFPGGKHGLVQGSRSTE
jgi:hypothetical protein